MGARKPHVYATTILPFIARIDRKRKGPVNPTRFRTVDLCTAGKSGKCRERGEKDPGTGVLHDTKRLCG
jgi:hypothetical protein